MAGSQQLKFLFFGSGLVFFRHRYKVIGNSVEIGMSFGIGVIADDSGDFARQLAVTVAIKQIDQAVIVFRDEDRNPRTIAAKSQLPLHRESFGDGRKSRWEIFHVESKAVQRELRAR